LGKKEEINAGRRDFFKKAGLGAGAAVISVTAGKAGAAEVSSPSKAAGYTETDHVRKYYELARF
jgi:hypothetical protein